MAYVVCEVNEQDEPVEVMPAGCGHRMYGVYYDFNHAKSIRKVYTARHAPLKRFKTLPIS